MASTTADYSWTSSASAASSGLGIPVLTAEPAVDDGCQDECCSSSSHADVQPDVDELEVCADACCSSSTSAASAPVIQLCRAEEAPTCCDIVGQCSAVAPFCRAPTAPSCCSPQLLVAPSSRTGLESSHTSPSPATRWRQAALLVSLATVAWNVVEGSLSVLYGSESVSVALLGFGADSWIEVLSAVVVAHRFWQREGDRAEATAKERRATLLIGSLLLVLALSITGGSLSALALREKPDSSIAGIVISSTALLVMSLLYVVKLSSVLFVGSLVSHFAGDTLWWFDGVTALIIALLVGREGYHAVRDASRPEFNGCSCCGENSGWYMQWLRKRQQRAG